MSVRQYQYAKRTKVPVPKTRSDIERVIRNHSGKAYISGWDDRGKAMVAFKLKERLIRFIMHDNEGQPDMRRWRALMLVIKAKLESVASGIETVEEAFLANIVTADGSTVWERVREPLKLEYERQASVPMLEGVEK
jgi:hypothetical protein